MTEMDYEVVYGNDLEDLETHVKNLLREGYRPVGGLVVVARERMISGDMETFEAYYQAMMKGKERER